MIIINFDSDFSFLYISLTELVFFVIFVNQKGFLLCNYNVKRAPIVFLMGIEPKIVLIIMILKRGPTAYCKISLKISWEFIS